jgi:cobyrinic acid a,c-diamide synthase
MQEACGTRQVTALTHAERERDAARAALRQAVEALGFAARESAAFLQFLDQNHFGLVARSDARPLREITQEATAAIAVAKQCLGEP